MALHDCWFWMSKAESFCLILLILNQLNCRAVMPLRLLPKSPSFTGVRPLKMEFLGFNLDESVLILINIHSVPCVEEAFHTLGYLQPLFIARKPKEVFRKPFIRCSSFFLLSNLVKSYSLLLKRLVKLVSTKLKVTAIIHLYSLKRLNCNISKCNQALNVNYPPYAE